MIHLNFTTDEMITIRIADDFGPLDAERIALLLEASCDDGFDKEINFKVASNLNRDKVQLLRNFCGHLPYKFHINLKYPLLTGKKLQ